MALLASKIIWLRPSTYKQLMKYKYDKGYATADITVQELLKNSGGK